MTSTTQAFRAFMTELIDYAGLFPPARLDLDPAIRNYASYCTDADAWMLGRFIIPAAKLDDLAPYHDELFAPASEPFRFAVLVGGEPEDSEAATLAKLQEQAVQIHNFKQRHGSAIEVAVLEARLPDEVATSGDTERTRAFLQAWPPILAGTEPRLYMEIAGANDWPRCVGSTIAGIASIAKIADVTENAGTSSPRVGVKLRCGGLIPQTFPPPERVALVIAECHKRGVPLKCTAGMHHPIRYHDTTIGVMSHGFLNVFGAGLLAHARDMSLDEITQCLLEENPANFNFTEEGFSWRDKSMTAAQVATARQEGMISFGSCSFDEPRDDLRKLGLLSLG